MMWEAVILPEFIEFYVKEVPKCFVIEVPPLALGIPNSFGNV